MKFNGLDLMTLAETGCLKIRRGCIANIQESGIIMVEFEGDESPVACDFLRTSSAPLPLLSTGDHVLCAIETVSTHGYVMGVIQPYNQVEVANANRNAAQEIYPHAQIKFNAEEKIILQCGSSSLTLEKEGKVIILGETITSRARGTHKIKGGSVQIN